MGFISELIKGLTKAPAPSKTPAVSKPENPTATIRPWKGSGSLESVMFPGDTTRTAYVYDARPLSGLSDGQEFEVEVMTVLPLQIERLVMVA